MGNTSMNWLSRLWRRLDALSASGWAVDALTALTLWSLTLMFSPLTEHSAHEEFTLAAVGTIVHFTVALSRGRYVEVPRPVRTDEVATNLIATTAGASAIIVTALLFNWRLGAVEMLGGAILVVSVLGLTGEVRRSRRRNSSLVPVVIIGTGDDAREVAELLIDHTETGFELEGVIGDRRVAERYGLDELWLGSTDRLISLMASSGATRAIVAPSSFRSESFRMIVENLMVHGFDVALSSGVSRIGVPRHSVHSVAHEPLVVLEARTPSRVHDVAKRVSDIAGSIVGLVFATPILVLAAVAIKFDDGGPVLYRQERVGRGGRAFSILKLRTMRVGTEHERAELMAQNQRTGPLFKVNGDERITRVGRLLRELSVDELPQLFNVFERRHEPWSDLDPHWPTRSASSTMNCEGARACVRGSRGSGRSKREPMHRSPPTGDSISTTSRTGHSGSICASCSQRLQMLLAAAVLHVGRTLIRRNDQQVDMVQGGRVLPPVPSDRPSSSREAYDAAS